MIIENTNTSGYVIQFINDATYNTIKYCKVKGVNSSATSGNILFSTTSVTTGNDYNTIENCDIFDGATTPMNSIYATGTASKENNNITISNNNIYNFYNSASSTNAGTGISINSCNNTWTISGNSFYQVSTRTAFNNGATMYGIYINNSSGNSFSVSDNYIGGSAPECGSDSMKINSASTVVFMGIYMNVGTTTASSVQNNLIKNISWTSSATNIWYGMYFAGGKVNIGTVTGNTIGSETGNGSITVSTTNNGSSSMGIYTAGSSATYVISNNKIGAINIAGAGVNHSFIGISNGATSSAITITSNYIGSPTTANSIKTESQNNSSNYKSSSLTGIYNNQNSANLNISNNFIYNLTNNYYYNGNSNSGLTRGIYITSGSSVTVSGNTVRHLTTSCGYYSSWLDDYSSTLTGIHVGFFGGTISQNTVYALKSSVTQVGTNLTGIYVNNSSASTAYVSKNIVHSLYSSYSGNVNIKGISSNGSSTSQTTYIINNMVRLGIDTYGNSLTNPHNYIGILQYSGNYGANDRIYHNSVYIGGTNVTNTSNSYAFYSAVLNNMREIYNNVFCNARSFSSVSASYFNYACCFAGYLPIPRGLFSNYNLYFASGTGGKLFFNTSSNTGYSTINAWRTANYTIDSNSAVGNPNYINPTGDSINLNLHVQSPTPVEASGIPIASVTDDFDGQTRSTLTPVDIGADAGNFTVTDVFGPKIIFTDIPNTTSTSNIVLNNFATITDNVGVSSGDNLPRLYFKKSTDNDAFVGNTSSDNGWKYVAASNSSNPYSFTIDYSIINGGSVSSGNIIQYFVVSQDDANNLSSQPFAASASGNPPVQNINGKTTPVKSYSIYANLGGTVTVGTGGNYPTLTGNGGLFEAINFGYIADNITANIISDITETGTVCLNQWTETGAGGYTLTIQPNGTTLRTLSGTAVNPHQPMININGADRVTIDGGSGKYLKFRNTNSNNQITGPTIQFDNGSTNCTISNCYIENNSKSGFCGTVTCGANGTNNITISYNDIRNPSSGSYTEQPYAQIFSNSTNNTLTIIGNNIYNFEAISYYGGYGIYLNAVASGCAISNNSFFNTVGTIYGGSSGLYSIYIYSGSGHTISGNYIGGTSANCGGTPMLFNNSSNQFSGLYLNVGTSSATSIQGNVIQNITCTSSSFYGISCNGGLMNIGTTTGNTIGHATTANSIQYGYTGTVYGICGQGTYGSNFENNTIANITSTTSSGSPTLIGIYVLSGGNCRKNKIYNLGTSQANSTPTIQGIRMYNYSYNTLEFSNNQIALSGGLSSNPTELTGIKSEGNYQCNIYYNTIYIYGAASTSSSACFKRTSSGTSVLRNNILYNARTTTGAGVHCAMSLTNTSGFTSTSSNYNFIVTPDSNKVCEWGTGLFKNFSEWKTATSGDVSSYSKPTAEITPGNFFVDVTNGNLNIITSNAEAWYVKGKGFHITTTATDINGNSRSCSVQNGATNIGSHEFCASQVPTQINAVPSQGGTNIFILNNRTLAVINWGATGEVPTNVSLQFYSGVNPGGTLTGRYGNAYWIIEATGGSGYSYDITLFYDTTIMGGITRESDIRLAKRPSGGDWIPYPTSTINTTNKTISLSGLTSFSEFALSDANSPMPVTLKSFNYNMKNRDVTLKWVTESEINNKGFEIERAELKNGNNEYRKIGFTESKNKNNEPLIYSFEDKKLASGKYRYRLKQIDNNGNFEYFELKNDIAVALPTKYDLSQNYPNPFNPTTKIDFQLQYDGKVTLQIYDITGKEIATLINNEFKKADYYTIVFNGNSLSSGVYFYTLTSDKFVMTKKMILVK